MLLVGTDLCNDSKLIANNFDTNSGMKFAFGLCVNVCACMQLMTSMQ